MVVDPGGRPRAAPENADHASRQREVQGTQQQEEEK
jgi:hypothetical protein